MNLETAQKIIEQEALLILLERPHLKFDVNNSYILADIFRGNLSKVVSIHRYGLSDKNEEFNYFFHTFKIDHPKHNVGYYNLQCGYDIYHDNTLHYKASMIIPILT